MQSSITTTKGYIISTLITFLAVFATVFFTQIQLTGFTFDRTSLTSLAIAALISGVRAVAKLIVERAAGVTTSPVSIVPPTSSL